MVTDIPAEVIHEAVRRLVQQSRNELDAGTVDYRMYDPMHVLGNTEQALDMAALSIAMRRIINSVNLN